MSNLTSKEKEKIFQDLLDNNSLSKQNLRDSQMANIDPKFNFSDTDFYLKYVKDEPWLPLLNHGVELFTLPFTYTPEDALHLYQVNMYCDLIQYQDLKDKKIIDIGCAYGKGVDILNRYYDYKVDGYDINKAFIHIAKETYPHLTFTDTLNIDDYDVLLFVNSLHAVWNSGLIHRLKDKQLYINDFFSADALNDFKTLLALNKWEVKLEEDVSQKWMYGMRKDIDTLDKRFPNVTSVSKNAYKHIQANRLRQFEVGSNRAYKYIIQC